MHIRIPSSVASRMLMYVSLSVLLLLPSASGVAQERDVPVTLSPAIGDTIRLADRDRYLLLTEFAGFEKAVLYLNADSSLRARIFFEPEIHKPDTVVSLHRSLRSLRNQVAQFDRTDLDMTSDAPSNNVSRTSGRRDFDVFATIEGGAWSTFFRDRGEFDYAVGFGLRVPLLKSSVFPLNATTPEPALFFAPRFGLGSLSSMFDVTFLFAECMIDFRLFTGFHLIAGPQVRGIVSLGKSGSSSLVREGWSNFMFLSYGFHADLGERVFIQFRQEPSVESLFNVIPGDKGYYFTTFVLGVSF